MQTLQKIFEQGNPIFNKNTVVVIPYLSRDEKNFYLQDSFPYEDIYLERCSDY